MWEAGDIQWWWRRPRATDDLQLPVWFDEAGPVVAARNLYVGAGFVQTSVDRLLMGAAPRE